MELGEGAGDRVRNANEFFVFGKKFTISQRRLRFLAVGAMFVRFFIVPRLINIIGTHCESNPHYGRGPKFDHPSMIGINWLLNGIFSESRTVCRGNDIGVALNSVGDFLAKLWIPLFITSYFFPTVEEFTSTGKQRVIILFLILVAGISLIG